MLNKICERILDGHCGTLLMVIVLALLLIMVSVQAGIRQGRKLQLNDDTKMLIEARSAVAEADARAQRMSDVLTVAYDALDWQNEQHRRMLCAWAVSKGYSSRAECYQKSN